MLITWEKLARNVEAARRGKCKERNRVPGFEIQSGCTMSNVSWMPVVHTLIACQNPKLYCN